MTGLGQSRGRHQPQPSGRRRLVRAVIVLIAAALVFLLGVAFSRALDERPRTGDPVTTVQTLSPRSQEAPARTVTETVTQP